MEKWVGFVGFGRTHGQGMWQFPIRLGIFRKERSNKRRRGGGGTLFGLFNTCRRFLCLLDPCCLIPPNLEPLLLELSVLPQTLPVLYILLAHSGSLAALMHSYTYQWLPVLRIASVSLY